MSEADIKDACRKIICGLKSLGAEISKEKPIANGVQFYVESFLGKGHVRVYSNKKKGTGIDLSQIDRAELAEAVRQIEKGIVPVIEKKKKELHYPIIGSDESGKGDLFGPIVCAAVFANEEDFSKLSELNVRDSKKNSDTVNLVLSDKIKIFLGSKFETLVMLPLEYNETYLKLARSGKNLNDLLCECHEKCIKELARRHKPKTVFIDKFSSCSFKGDMFERTVLSYRAEENPVVAAASVLARAAFLTEIKKMSQKYKMEIPTGSAEKAFSAAVKLIRKQGKDELPKALKTNFGTAAKALSSIFSTEEGEKE
ncbi:hypothetical protein JW890_00520 [candidate division WOR-3 bacterium]|nr:hypothetical protein [candidate division WOR-3 bacterium]